MTLSKHGTPLKKRKLTAVSSAVLATLIALGVLLTGCTVQYGLDTKVETDGSGTVGIRLAADKELQDALSSAADSLGGLGDLGDLGRLGDLGDLGMLGSILGGLGDAGILEELGTLGRVLETLRALGDLTGELPASVDDLFNLILGQIPGDWQVERGTDSSGTSWVSLTRSFSDLEELKQIMSESVIASIVPMDEFYITQDKGFFGTKTVFSTSLDPKDAMSGAQGGSSSLPADLLETVLAIQNRLTLPGNIGDNNADQLEGNTLVWNIGLSGKTEMYAESVVRNWAAIIGVIVGAVVVVALIVLAVLLLLRRRRRKSSPSRPTEGEPRPTTARPVPEQGASAQAQPDVEKSTGPAAQTEVTEVRPRAETIAPPVGDTPPAATVAATTVVTGATVAGAAVEPSTDDDTPVGAVTADETVPPVPGEPATVEETPLPGEAGVAEDAPSAEDAVPLAAEAAAADAPATVAARPPTPIPLRPSRLSAQEAGGEAADDTTASTDGAGPAEHPATKAVEEESDPA